MRRLLSAALVVAGATVAACIHGPVVTLPTPQPAVGSAANAALTQRKYGDSILHGGLHKVYTDGVTITGTGTQADPLVGASGLSGGVTGDLVDWTSPTTVGSVGLSSNLRTSGGALDLSTAVTMPGSLAVKSLAGTAQSVTTSADDVALAATTTVVNYTGTLDTTWGGFVSTGERWIYVVNTTAHALALIGEDASTTAADRITTNMGSDGFSIPPHSGTWLKYDTVTSRWLVTGIFGNTCPGSEFADGINPDGSLACATPAAGGTIASTTDLLVGDGAGNASAFGGSSPSACAGGSVLTRVVSSATGALTFTCGITPITGTLTSGKVPIATGASAEGDSDISDNTTSQAIDLGSSSGSVITTHGSTHFCSACTNESQLLSTGTSNLDAGDATSTITLGASSGAVQIGKSGHSTDIEGSITTHSTTALGTAWSNAINVHGQPRCVGTTPTVTGTGATIVGTNCSGIVTLGGSGLSTFTIDFDASNPWSNTPPCTFTWVASSNVALWISSQSTTAVAVKLASTGIGAVNYQCGWGY